MLDQTERNLLMKNMPEFRGNFVAALNERALFEGADLAVMFTHFVLVVMATKLVVYLLYDGYMQQLPSKQSLKLMIFQP